MTTTPYEDEHGNPRIRNSITAFLDVLGFSQSVVAAEKAGQSQQCLDSIIAALNEAKKFVRGSLSKEKLADASLWITKAFSDNLLLGYPYDSEVDSAEALALVIQCTQRYQLQMAISGFFVRGALSLGPLCVTDEIVYGTALIDSYQMESNVSIVPRVILSESLAKDLKETFDVGENLNRTKFSQLICKDIDGWWFVNYLQAAVERGAVNWELISKHKEEIISSIPKAPRHDILPKYGWVTRYHNVFCHWHRADNGYKEEYRIRRIDEDSEIRRLGDTATS